jgi:hypothetical protein
VATSGSPIAASRASSRIGCTSSRGSGAETRRKPTSSWPWCRAATSAAARDMPGYHIQQHTRHKRAQMVAGYIREADKWTKSGLKGVGF